MKEKTIVMKSVYISLYKTVKGVEIRQKMEINRNTNRVEIVVILTMMMKIITILKVLF